MKKYAKKFKKIKLLLKDNTDVVKLIRQKWKWTGHVARKKTIKGLINLYFGSYPI